MAECQIFHTTTAWSQFPNTTGGYSHSYGHLQEWPKVVTTCQTHGISFDMPTTGDVRCLCPVGRIEEAVEKGVARLEEAARKISGSA